METGEQAEACRPASLAYAEVNKKPSLKVEGKGSPRLSFNVFTHTRTPELMHTNTESLTPKQRKAERS